MSRGAGLLEQLSAVAAAVAAAAIAAVEEWAAATAINWTDSGGHTRVSLEVVDGRQEPC